ncbi:MAG: heavy-metal-associated domain-containing protein [Planctomycetes bacterium]|nr:heavy-metal-associated domain-containing protein [Planctomycetota bacterium]
MEAEPEQQIDLNIRGMTCDACTLHVEKALKSVDGVWFQNSAERRITPPSWPHFTVRASDRRWRRRPQDVARRQTTRGTWISSAGEASPSDPDATLPTGTRRCAPTTPFRHAAIRPDPPSRQRA